MKKILGIGMVFFLVGQGLLFDFLLFLACIGYQIVIEAPPWYIEFMSRWFVIVPIK